MAIIGELFSGPGLLEAPRAAGRPDKPGNPLTQSRGTFHSGAGPHDPDSPRTTWPVPPPPAQNTQVPWQQSQNP